MKFNKNLNWKIYDWNYKTPKTENHKQICSKSITLSACDCGTKTLKNGACVTGLAQSAESDSLYSQESKALLWRKHLQTNPFWYCVFVLFS
jgi:hypothetical protein